MISDVLEAVLDADSAEAVWEIHTREMARYGFKRLLYGFSRFCTPEHLGCHDDIVILTNHCADYVSRFFHDGLYRDAPMLRWAQKNVGAMSWRWIRDRQDELSPAEQKVVALNTESGITAGYTISFDPLRTGAYGVISLAAAKGAPQEFADAIWEEHGREIHALNKVVHLKLVALPAPVRGQPLTDRQREALEWVGTGKNLQDTAVLMGLKPVTVEKHLRLAREALNVETTAHAVLRASAQNQIFVVGR